AVLVTALLLVIFKFSQPEPPVKEKEEKTWAVQTHQLIDGVKVPQLELYGQVESPYTATVTAIINADILSLDVKEGQVVNKDQLLIKLDELDAKLTLDQRASDVAELEASIESEKNRHKNDLSALKLEKSLVSLAKKKLSREEKTSKSNLTSQNSFDTQKQALQNQELALKARELSVKNHPARLAQLEAKLAHKRALLQQAERDLQRADVLAPFDGIVLSTSVSPGERVRPGEELLKLYSIDNVELRAQLPQKYVDTVKQALAREETLSAVVRTAHADVDVTLHRVSGAVSNTGIGVDALLEINSYDANLFVMGEVHEVILNLPAITDVYSIPVSSIYGTNRIYRVEKGRLAAINVEKLGVQIKGENQFILVRSDRLAPGDEIITTQLPHAMSGLKVDVRNATPAELDTPESVSQSGQR
ncbi:MAG: HlyD family efflux transporter periplasmic adaptor subunit, partial [Gammaproteobacteria bacterium]|nr:HlyD family efflux transporter periplasmic adaptor subunit [Gammaproteobacteria bacterium]